MFSKSSRFSKTSCLGELFPIGHPGDAAFVSRRDDTVSTQGEAAHGDAPVDDERRACGVSGGELAGPLVTILKATLYPALVVVKVIGFLGAVGNQAIAVPKHIRKLGIDQLTEHPSVELDVPPEIVVMVRSWPLSER